MALNRVALSPFCAKVISAEAWKTVDAISLSDSANTVVLNLGSDTTQQYEVMFNLVSSAATRTEVLCQVGVDTAATGSLTNHWWRNYVAYRYTSGWQGPFIIHEDDDVMGWASSADAVDLMIKVRRIQT